MLGSSRRTTVDPPSAVSRATSRSRTGPSARLPPQAVGVGRRSRSLMATGLLPVGTGTGTGTGCVLPAHRAVVRLFDDRGAAADRPGHRGAVGDVEQPGPLRLVEVAEQ